MALIRVPALATALVSFAAAACLTLPAPARSQTIPPARMEKPAPPISNPLADVFISPMPVRDPGVSTLMRDYRNARDPRRQKERKQEDDELPVFGFNYFEPARQIIDARRAALRNLIPDLQGQFEGARRPGEKSATRATKGPRQLEMEKAKRRAESTIPTQEELDAIDKLTDAQKLDLLQRQRDNRLTPEEKRMYRFFLYPNGVQEPPTASQEDPASRLSDAQKVELLIRLRDNKISPEERQIYRRFLYPTQQERTLDEQNAISRLDDQQKIDLLQRLRENKLTDEEKRKYRSFLYPTQAEVSQDTGDLSSTLTDAQKLRLLTRKQEGKLTDEEKQKYHAFLFPGQQDETAIDQNGAPNPQLPQPRADLGRRLDQTAAIDAFTLVADPLAQIYQNVTASAPSNYQLGIGDSIVVRIWSPTLDMREYPVRVDQTGSIAIPVVGRFIVRGMTTAQAENAMKGQIQRIYRSADLSITTRELRTIPITLTGDVYSGGTYQVPSTATAINMIYSTGGPSDNGSLRRIEVRRRGKLVGTIDFYKFLITGDTTGDIDLQPGDVVFVPGHQNRVTMRGEVLRPAVYELLPGESLKEALIYAGGVKASGVVQRIQVATVAPGAARLLKDVDARDEKQVSAVPVYDGDSVDVFSLRNAVMNKVTIEGAVDQPGEYALGDKMTIADLVERARGLVEDAYPGRADIFRYNPDSTLTRFQVQLDKAMKREPGANIPLSRWDLIRIYTRQEVAWTGRREVTVRGAVRKAGIYYRSDNMKVKDLLLDAGGTIPEAYMQRAALLHHRPDGTYAYEYVNLALAVKDDPQHNVPVQDRDVLAVYRNEEANFTPEHIVTISGEVVTPAKYPRGDGMKLSDLLKLAGGLTPRAGEKIRIAHARSEESAEPNVVGVNPTTGAVDKDMILQDGDLVTIQGRGTYHDKPFMVTVRGAVNRPGPVLLKGRSMRLTDVIKEAGGLKPEAFPQGVEFTRFPELLASTGQKQVADIINQLNDLLNQSKYKTELAKSDLERIRAYGSAVRGDNPLAGSSVGLAGLLGGDSGIGSAPARATGLFGRDLVAQPRSLTKTNLEPNGNVAVNLAAAMAKPGAEDDIIMLDGDEVIVPVQPTTVQVIGAVFNARGVLYRPGERSDYYVDRAGGYAPDAAKDRILVIRLGGGLIPLNKLKAFEPGDVILVPTKVLAERISNKSAEIDHIFRNLTSSALIFALGSKLFGL